MSRQMQSVRDLAAVVGGMPEARALLAQAGISAVGDLYDSSALEAMRREPLNTNIGRKKKDRFTLAETDGIGAMKAVCDAADLDIVRHVYCGMNYLTVANAKKQRRVVKVYTRARMGLIEKHADFTICGFLREDAPKYYMLMCFEGPIAWVIKQTDLVKAWSKLSAGGLPEDYLSCPRQRSEIQSRSGIIRAHMKIDDRFVLKSPKQLDL